MQIFFTTKFLRSVKHAPVIANIIKGLAWLCYNYKSFLLFFIFIFIYLFYLVLQFVYFKFYLCKHIFFFYAEFVLFYITQKLFAEILYFTAFSSVNNEN